jgi:cytoskeleton protein RodZ
MEHGFEPQDRDQAGGDASLMVEMDQDGAGTAPVGERLRRAREAKGMSLDDVASQTRIPTRHLHHIEQGEWDALPAITYSVGFARAYGNAVGLDGAAIGAEVRELLGSGPKPTVPQEFYEPADPARVPPRALAIVALVLAVLLAAGYLMWRSGATGDEAADAETGVEVPLPDAQPAGPAPGLAQPLGGPPPGQDRTVSLTATGEVWLRIDDGPGGAALFQGILQPGQRFDVPSTAQRPIVRTGRPQLLRLSVGGTEVGAIEPVERTVSNISLLPEEVLARGAGRAQPAQPAPAPAPQQ